MERFIVPDAYQELMDLEDRFNVMEDGDEKTAIVEALEERSCPHDCFFSEDNFMFVLSEGKLYRSYGIDFCTACYLEQENKDACYIKYCIDDKERGWQNVSGFQCSQSVMDQAVEWVLAQPVMTILKIELREAYSKFTSTWYPNKSGVGGRII